MIDRRRPDRLVVSGRSLPYGIVASSIRVEMNGAPICSGHVRLPDRLGTPGVRVPHKKFLPTIPSGYYTRGM